MGRVLTETRESHGSEVRSRTGPKENCGGRTLLVPSSTVHTGRGSDDIIYY